ncbi:hypothetical protein HLB44_09685 [Aquincola sp. S2]|uniref:Flagellar hook-length control protein FliK n=1 Tax=Pseudaquabacterium terrae TaxID=2732868 RepID=A0ABX2EF75_9BURK|nr:hypothetical protein [Aquabacterium terrae]NRF67253.1 hypothetical protein [Aquabacterium terrae]
MKLGAAAAAPAAGDCALPPPASAPAGPADEGRGQALQRPATSATTGRLGEQFARALLQQAGADEPATPTAEATTPAGLLAWPPATPHAPPLAAAPTTPAVSAGGDQAAAACAAQAAAQTRDAAACTPIVVTPTDAGTVWELSLNDPDGLALSLRAERVVAPQPAGAAPAPWTLAITTPTAEAAAALRQHAPRLADRLAARALAPAHLRIADQRPACDGHAD